MKQHLQFNNFSTLWYQHDQVQLLIVRETLLKLSQDKIQSFAFSIHIFIFNAKCYALNFRYEVTVV
jgi:hypothetical protein